MCKQRLARPIIQTGRGVKRSLVTGAVRRRARPPADDPVRILLCGILARAEVSEQSRKQFLGRIVQINTGGLRGECDGHIGIIHPKVKRAACGPVLRVRERELISGQLQTT